VLTGACMNCAPAQLATVRSQAQPAGHPGRRLVAGRRLHPSTAAASPGTSRAQQPAVVEVMRSVREGKACRYGISQFLRLPAQLKAASARVGTSGATEPGAIFRDSRRAAVLARVESPSPRAVGGGLLAGRRRAVHHPGRPVNPACSRAAQQAPADSPMQSRAHATA
jgi:hypothetical protein